MWRKTAQKAEISQMSIYLCLFEDIYIYIHIYIYALYFIILIIFYSIITYHIILYFFYIILFLIILFHIISDFFYNIIIILYIYIELGKSTISMAMFNSKLFVFQRVSITGWWFGQLFLCVHSVGKRIIIPTDELHDFSEG